MQILLIFLLFLTFACRDQGKAVEKTTQLVQTPVNSSILTQPLNPQAIRIISEKLPEPFATNSASKSPNILPIPPKPTLNVPKGFQVKVFAEGLDHPRWLALTPTGEVLVTETRQNRITLLRDANGDGTADSRKVFADAKNGLDIPFGMAFAQNSFFLGNHNGVRHYSYRKGEQGLTGEGKQIASLPGGGYRQHWTRNVILSPDQQKLYVSIGSRSNADAEPLPRATVQVMNLDGLRWPR